MLSGLMHRTDLNGQVVTLLKWSKKHERWEVRCSDGKEIRVRQANLAKTGRAESAENARVGPRANDAQEPCHYVLDPAIGTALKQSVCGGSMFPQVEGIPHQAGSGQISRVVFDNFADLATEVYGGKSSVVLAMLLDFVGKDGDSGLVCQKLKAKISEIFHPQNMAGFVLPIPASWSKLMDMDTATDLGTLMFNLREGTLAFIESHQGMLAGIVSEMKGSKMMSNRNEPGTILTMIMCGKDDNKSMKCTTLQEELKSAAMGGEVTVFGKGFKKVEVNEFMHRSYVNWLIQDVLPTLSPSDARKGSLGEWHRLTYWEKQLTESIQAKPVRLMLDVSDDFDLTPWLEGLVSLDLSVLSDAPGVDTDRRILRLAFFAELAWQFSLKSGAWDRKQQASLASSSEADDSSTAVGDALNTDMPDLVKSEQDCFKKNSKVVVIGLEEKEHSLVCNGMEGRILSQVDSDHYSVSFTNLTQPKTIQAFNLQRVAKVVREEHHCFCGQSGDFLCSRCNMTWYCSAECQTADYGRHKLGCKAMVSKFGFNEVIRQVDKMKADDASQEESDS